MRLNPLWTTDTYSLPQGQDEFYFAVPYDKMDLCLYGKNNGYSTEEVAKAQGEIISPNSKKNSCKQPAVLNGGRIFNRSHPF